MKSLFNFKKFFVFVIVMSLLVSSQLLVAAESTNSGLDEEAQKFLKSHNVNENIISAMNSISLEKCDSTVVASNNEMVLNLKEQAEAYDFDDRQIEAYVKGLINTPTNIVAYSDKSATLRNTPYSTNRPWDKGIGYEVKSKSGYYQETAFATLPTVYRDGVNGSSTYMFYSFSGTYGIDVGLWYGYGAGGYGWRDCYTKNDVQKTVNGLIGVDSGDEVYLQAYITDNYYVRCRILDANDFSDVKSDFSIWVGSGIPKSSAVINRQISLCNDDANFDTGEYLHNAEFDNAYIYSTSGYSQTLPSNTQDDYCGVFGTNSTNAKQVTVNNHEEWFKENIDIDF